MTNVVGGCSCFVVLPGIKLKKKRRLVGDGQSLERTSETPSDGGEYTEGWPEVLPEEDPDESCFEGGRRSCTTKKPGICRAGERICENGRWSPCRPLELPTLEKCDGLDNDCDGRIDEFLIRDCPYSGPQGTKGVGPCRAGQQRCVDAKWGECRGEVLPKSETCNKIDDDCDGAIDEWLPIQQISKAYKYSEKGDPTHIYMSTTKTGYIFGWSETATQSVFLTSVKVDGSRARPDWPVTKPPDYGNIHGLTNVDGLYAVAWDTDKGASVDASALVALYDNTGKRVVGPVYLQKGGIKEKTRMVNPQVAYGPGFIGAVWSDFEKKKLHVRTFDKSFKPLGPRLSFDVSIRLSPYTGLAFSGDRVATVWITEQKKVKVAVVSKKSTLIGKVVEINVPGQNPSDAQIAGYKDGYLLVWTDTGVSRLWSQRLDRDGKPTEPAQTILYTTAYSPILKPTSFGAILAWVETKNSVRGISVARINTRGRLLASPSWFSVPDVENYLAMAWADLGLGQGRGAIAWINSRKHIMVAPLGCVLNRAP